MEAEKGRKKVKGEEDKKEEGGEKGRKMIRGGMLPFPSSPSPLRIYVSEILYIELRKTWPNLWQKKLFYGQTDTLK